jgi:hypothetical protein
VCTLNNVLSVVRQDIARGGLRLVVGARVVMCHIDGGLKPAYRPAGHAATICTDALHLVIGYCPSEIKLSSNKNRKNFPGQH